MHDVQFNIVTGMLKAFEGEDGIKRLSTTASSTVLDLGGDQMELSALESMASTAKNNMTIFLNHKYQVPEDVLGSVENAIIKIANGGGVYDLDFDIRVDETNDRAVKAWKQIQNGTKLGCSIGARIPEGGYEKTKTGMKISDVYLMEASIVGIPANPRSFVHYAMKALHEAEREEEAPLSAQTVMPAVPMTLGENGPEVFTTGNSNTLSWDLGNVRTITTDATTTFLYEVEAPLPADDSDEPATISAEDIANAPIEDVTGESDESTTESDATESPSAEGDSSGGEPSQEASASVPESDGIDDEDTRTVIAKGIETLEALLHAAKDELVDSRKALADETAARVKAEHERDQFRQDLKLARDIVERISALPIGRRTSFKATASEFRTKFAGVYDDEVLKLLERESNGG